MAKSLRPPLVRKGKLVIVDLAGSERIDKSGNEIRSTKLSPLRFNCLINDGPIVHRFTCEEHLLLFFLHVELCFFAVMLQGVKATHLRKPNLSIFL